MKMLTVSVTGARMWTWVRKCPSWFCAGRCPRRPADEQWAGTRGRTAASSSRWAGPPAGSGSGPDTAAPTRCNADLLLSWTDLPTGDMSSGVSVITSVISQSIHPSIVCSRLSFTGSQRVGWSRTQLTLGRWSMDKSRLFCGLPQSFVQIVMVSIRWSLITLDIDGLFL